MKLSASIGKMRYNRDRQTHCPIIKLHVDKEDSL